MCPYLGSQFDKHTAIAHAGQSWRAWIPMSSGRPRSFGRGATHLSPVGLRVADHFLPRARCFESNQLGLHRTTCAGSFQSHARSRQPRYKFASLENVDFSHYSSDTSACSPSLQ